MTDWIASYEKELPSDMIISAVTAFRIWYIPAERPWLHSWTMVNCEWKPLQKIEAICLSHLTCATCKDTQEGNPTHTEDSCNAGIYAFKTQKQAQDEFIDQLENLVQCCILAREEEGIIVPDDPRNRVAVGKVYLWGKVLECTKGFRGQYAYPAALYNTSPNSAALAELYRVPLIAFKEL